MQVKDNQQVGLTLIYKRRSAFISTFVIFFFANLTVAVMAQWKNVTIFHRHDQSMGRSAAWQPPPPGWCENDCNKQLQTNNVCCTVFRFLIRSEFAVFVKMSNCNEGRSYLNKKYLQWVAKCYWWIGTSNKGKYYIPHMLNIELVIKLWPSHMLFRHSFLKWFGLLFPFLPAWLAAPHHGEFHILGFLLCDRADYKGP